MAHATAQFFGSHRPLGPWGGAKGQISLNLKSISNIFKPNFAFLLTNERYKNILDGIYIGSPGSCTRVWDFGVLGDQKFNFLNIVMWHKVDELKPRIH